MNIQSLENILLLVCHPTPSSTCLRIYVCLCMFFFVLLCSCVHVVVVVFQQVVFQQVLRGRYDTQSRALNLMDMFNQDE